MIEKRNTLKQELKIKSGVDSPKLEKQVHVLEKEIANLTEEENMKTFINDFGPFLNSEGPMNTNGKNKR